MSGCKNCSGECAGSSKKHQCGCEDEGCCSENTYKNVNYVEVPFGVQADCSQIKNPTSGKRINQRVYLIGSKEYGVITDIRYHDYVVRRDSDGQTSIYNHRFVLTEEEGKEYEEKSTSILSPTPPNPFK